MELPPSQLSHSHTPTSPENLADTAAAAAAVHQLHLSTSIPDHHDHPLEELDDFCSSQLPDPINDDDTDDGDGSEFEFCILSDDHNHTPPISADDIFSNGQMKPMYPLFDTTLLHQHATVSDKQPQRRPTTPSRLPLRKLTTTEEAAGDVDGVPHDHNNKKIGTNDNMKKKSKSTGSNGNNSKRWIDHLVGYSRSNSDGEDKFVFSTRDRHGGVHQIMNGGGGGGDVSNKKQPIPDDKKKRTYLPYRQGLVGFFSVPTGLNGTVRPFY